MKKITFVLCLFSLLVVGSKAEAAGLEQKVETYLDKQAQAEQAHKNMGKNDMNTDWMKNFDAGAKKKSNAKLQEKDSAVSGSDEKK